MKGRGGEFDCTIPNPASIPPYILESAKADFVSVVAVSTAELYFILQILYITRRARPLFAVAQALWYEAHSRCDIIEDVTQDSKNYRAV